MKRVARRYLPVVLILAAIVVVYRGWLASGVITYGDWNIISRSQMRDYWPIPSLWQGAYSTGNADILSGPMFPLLFLHGLLNQFGVSFAVSERLIWIFPGVLIGALATYGLALLFFASRLAGIISALFVVFNSYIVIIMTGGQFTVSSAYGLMPLILLLFYRALRQPAVSRYLLTAVCLSIQVMFDLRTTYLTLAVLMVFSLYYVSTQCSRPAAARAAGRIALQFVLMAIVGGLIHGNWLLPGHYAERIALPAGYDSTDWVYRLSYMHLSHALALFHPFWYQDTQTPTAGAVLPVFYVLPLVVFGVLLRKRLTFVELFLSSVALLAIFCVKGDNPPGGAIYNWLFTHLPGFSMYRDPSKFFQPLGLAYGLLLGRVAMTAPTGYRGVAARSVRAVVRSLAVIVCAGVVLIPVVPVAASSPWGTFAPQTLPAEYAAFDHFLARQPQFFRVMWYQGSNTLIASSGLHPSIDAGYVGQTNFYRYLPNTPRVASWLQLPQAMAVLRALSVKYIAVLEDPRDTAPNRAQKEQDVRFLHQTFPSFPEISIGQIHLFLNRSYLPPAFVSDAAITPAITHALLRRAAAPAVEQRDGMLGEFSAACASCMRLASHSNTRYEAIINDAKKPFLLVLNQSFDPNWKVYIEPTSAPQPFWWTWTHPALPGRVHMTVNGYANAWWINARGTYRIVVEYWPQRFVDVGFIVCWLTILLSFGYVLGCYVAARPWQRSKHASKEDTVLGIPVRDTVLTESAIQRRGAR